MFDPKPSDEFGLLGLDLVLLELKQTMVGPPVRPISAGAPLIAHIQPR